MHTACYTPLLVKHGQDTTPRTFRHSKERGLRDVVWTVGQQEVGPGAGERDVQETKEMGSGGEAS